MSLVSEAGGSKGALGLKDKDNATAYWTDSIAAHSFASHTKMLA